MLLLSNKTTYCRYRQRGSALIIAMLVVAMATVIVIALIEKQRIILWRTNQVLTANQAYYYALGVEDWATGIVKQYAVEDKEKKSRQLWPVYLSQTTIPGGAVSGELQDLQARINLNNLTIRAKQPGFVHLLEALGIDETKSKSILGAIVDWINPNQSQHYANLYEQEDPPYRAANQPLKSVSELRLIAGIDDKLYRKLLPYVTALPSKTAINVNTASLIVLMSLSKDMTTADAEKIIQYRQLNQGYKNSQAFLSQPFIRPYRIKASNITTNTHYFLSRADVTLGNQHLLLWSLLNFQVTKKEITIKVIWRSRGTL